MSWSNFRKIRKKLLELAIRHEKVDEPIIELLQLIFKNKNLVTLSSCSGRIVLIEFDFKGRKKTARFFRKWHRKVESEEVELALAEHTGERTLWFKVEPFILHVAARNINSANTFLEKIRGCGVKRGGIQSIKKDKVTIEVQGNNQIIMPVNYVEGEWNKIIEIANTMLDDNFSVLKKLEKRFIKTQ